MENNKCVYVHKDKEGVVKYVGSGTLRRASETYANSKRGKAYTEYVEANGKLKVEIVVDGLAKLEAEDLERELYDKFKESILNHKKPVSTRLISKEMFDEYLYYDETSPSCLRWKVDMVSGNSAFRMKVNSEAGSLDRSIGYYAVRLQGVNYKAHRIVALLHDLEVNGFVVDHIDRDRANNKISNLRIVSQKENLQNKSQQKLSSNNSSGIKGVFYNKLGYWTTTWCEEGKKKFKHFPIKNFTSSEEAFQKAIDYRNQMIDLHYNKD